MKRIVDATKMIGCLWLLISLGNSVGYAQKAVQLTNQTSGAKQLIKEGHRIQFTLKSDMPPYPRHVGELNAITDSTITVDEQVVSLTELKTIGRKRKGSGFWSVASTVVGTGLIIGSIANSSYDPCPDCEGDDGSNAGMTIVEVGLGAAFIGLGINTIVRNSPRDLAEKWKLEIVDSR